MIDYCYGVDMSRVRFIPNFAKYILEHFATEELLTRFKDFCEDYPQLVENGEAEEFFIVEYTDNSPYASGIAAFLVRCINDNECPTANAFSYKDYCLGVKARIPANDEEKAKMLTQEDIRRILVKYLNPILESDVTVEFLEIFNETDF